LSSDLTTALSAALPAHLQHLAGPLVRYLEAARDLQAVANDLTTLDAVRQALSSLQGTPFSLPAGVVTLGADNNMGDVSMRDVVNGTLINITLPQPAVSPPVRPSHGLDDGQLRILRMLATKPVPSVRINYAEFGEQLGMSAREVEDEFKLLKKRVMLEVKLYVGSGNVELTPEASKLLRKLDSEAADALQ